MGTISPIDLKAFITYDGLPLKSGGAHHLSSKSPQVIYASLLQFLNLYTDSKHANDVRIELLSFDLKKVFKYSLRFGIPYFNWSSFLVTGQKFICWKIYSRRSLPYIDLIANSPDLKLAIIWKFKFVDTNTREVLPGQAAIPVIDERFRNSYLYLRLSSTQSTVSVWFAFPFDNLIEDNLKYINGMQEVLPFKFSGNSWRLWKRSKNDNWIPNKISLPIEVSDG